MKKAGFTHREIGLKYNLTKLQIKELVKRYNKKERQKALGIEPKPQGRPRLRKLTKEQELGLENKRLKTENDLLRSFLQAAGRK